MKKKYSILISILIIAVCCITLTACTDTTDYSGNATITYIFDKPYENITISCPSAEIEGISATEYKVQLNSTKPVEVLINADGNTALSYTYTTKQLKKGNISQNVSFTEPNFVLEVQFDVENVDLLQDNATVVGRDDITITRVKANKYNIQSKSKINENLEVCLADAFKNVIIPKQFMVYMYGNYGKVANTITAVKKDSNQSVVLVNTDCTLVSVANPQGTKQVSANKQTAVDIQDYYITVSGNDSKVMVVDTIKKEDLADAPCKDIKLNCLNIIRKQEDYIDYDSIRVLDFDAIAKYNYQNEEIKLVSSKAFTKGTLICFYAYDDNYYHYNGFCYELTQQDIDNGYINLVKQTQIENSQTKDYNVKFNVVDNLGNKVGCKGAKLVPYYKEYVDGYWDENGQWINGHDKTVPAPTQDFNDVCVLSKDKPFDQLFVEVTDNSGKVSLIEINDFINKAIIKDIINTDSTQPLQINVYFDEVTTKKVIFKDKITGETVKEEEVPLHYNDIVLNTSQDIQIDAQNYIIVDNKFTILNNQYLLYFSKDFDNGEDIIIEVEKAYSVKLVVNGYMEDVTKNDICKNYKNDIIGEIYFYRDYERETIYADIRVADSMKNVKYYFATDRLWSSSYEKYYFEVTIPDILEDNMEIPIQIKGVQNEWKDVDDQFNNHNNNNYW